MKTSAEDIHELAVPASPGRQPLDSSFAFVEVDIAGLSDVGKVRANNEDHFLVVRFGRFLESLLTNVPVDLVPSRYEDVGYGMAVADGMGGHASGEEASKIAITTLVNLVLATPDWMLRLDDTLAGDVVMSRATERFRLIDRAMAEEADENPRLHGFGTTMTLAASLGKNLLLAHIGDSRAYLFRREKLHQLTHDHTLVRELYEAGLITLAQAATHRLRHALTRHLGADSAAKPDVEKMVLEDGDCLLLCSDGLTEMVSNEQIAAILASGETSETTCQRLVDRALTAGGKDNVTVVVARYEIPSVS
jgi:protein phosphatase